MPTNELGLYSARTEKKQDYKTEKLNPFRVLSVLYMKKVSYEKELWCRGGGEE